MLSPRIIRGWLDLSAKITILLLFTNESGVIEIDEWGIKMSEFKDKVVVVQAPAEGLDALMLEFAKRGAKVVVNDLGGSADGVGASDMADQVVQEIRDQGGIAIANKASVSDGQEQKVSSMTPLRNSEPLTFL